MAGSRSMVSFEDVRGGNGSNRSLFHQYEHEDNGTTTWMSSCSLGKAAPQRERVEPQNSLIPKSVSEPTQNPTADSLSECEVSKVSAVASKQEDLSSGKSDIFDSDSPHYTDGVHSSILEPGDSSYVFEPDQSDLSKMKKTT
ncbi:homeobox 1 [Prunus dulcis]|uniref:Homeobox 1 n=1 Tax=Prunus dulcis TaxID=3755 RepID=A0A4Y1RJJ6_PRUDU|nr:homeobox 1 [Prunus dulcis]